MPPYIPLDAHQTTTIFIIIPIYIEEFNRNCSPISDHFCLIQYIPNIFPTYSHLVWLNSHVVHPCDIFGAGQAGVVLPCVVEEVRKRLQGRCPRGGPRGTG